MSKKAGKHCSYCHGVIKPSQQIIECSKCSGIYHVECWNENDGCAVYGCKDNSPAKESSEKMIISDSVWKESFYEYGEIKSEGEFKHEFRQGTHKFYYEESYGERIEAEGNFINGFREGIHKFYFEGDTEEKYGPLKSEGRFIKGLREGIHKFYNPITPDEYVGSLGGETIQAEYKKGKQVGKWKWIVEPEYKKDKPLEKEYHANGKLKTEGNNTTGVWKSYFENGNLKSEEICCPIGVIGREGQIKTYYENGNPRFEGYFVNSKLDGWARSYYEYGPFSLSCIFSFLFDSSYPESYQKGALMEEGNYINDVKDGLWKEYYKNGQLKEESIWFNDEKVLVNKYASNGAKIN